MENFTQTISQFSVLIKLRSDSLESLEGVEKLSNDFVQEFQYTAVSRTSHKFSPIGITHLTILSESHLAIHTWPEFRRIHIDLVSCKNIPEEKIRMFFEKYFEDNIENFEISKKDIKLS